MSELPIIRLKKHQDRRVRSGHPWIYSNEIDVSVTPIKSIVPGSEVVVQASDQTLLGLAYLNPHSLIAGRMLSTRVTDQFTHELLCQRIHSALQLRNRLFPKPYYRLIFSEGDQLPGVVIDRFGDHLVMQINTAGMALKSEMWLKALRQTLPEVRSILLRNDSPVREQEGLEPAVTPLYGNPPEVVLLEENQVQFKVPIWQGQKTGWFYDHRLNRARLASYVKDQTVLDVFSYLGGFGIQAAAMGAKSVECIDTSAFACGFIQQNAELNHVADRVSIHVEDAFDALKSRIKQGKTYDVVILDPPAFVKKFKDRQEGLIAYQRVNEMALKLLIPGGILISCSCSMHVSQEDLLNGIQRAAYRARCEPLQWLESGHQGPDHPRHLMLPESDYLKALFLRKASS